MSEAPQAGGLFPAADGERSTGLLPAQLLRAAVLGGHEIIAAAPIGEDQIQPASIDLRLGEVAYRVRASFLLGARASVADNLQQLSMHRIDLAQGAVLEKDCVYIVKLLEHLALRQHGDEFAGCHGEGAGKESCHPGEHDDAWLGRGACHAHDETGVGDEPIIYPEHACPQRAAAERAVPLANILDGFGPWMSGRRLRLAAVDRNAAHFGGGEDVAHGARTEGSDAFGDQPSA